MSLKGAAGRSIRVPWVWFQAVGRFIGHLNNTLLLSLSFFLILLPIGVIRRAFRPEKDAGGWLKRESSARNHFEKQY